MRKPIKIHVFDPVIYPRYVYIVIGLDIEHLKKTFKIDKASVTDLETLEGDVRGIGFRVVEKATGSKGILMIFRNKNIAVSTIAHEALHIADYIFEEIGAVGQSFSDKDEPFAYLVGWVAKCIDEVKHFKENNNARNSN